MGSAPTRVFFHVGAPKTGTTYLQNVLFQNREALARRGVLYPYADPGQSFRSMQDFRGVGWGGTDASAYAGEWDEVAARIRDWDGHTVIVSNELLGGSRPERIAAGLESIGDGEVHVIFTARDLARQLVSDWQEHIKHKHTVTLETFIADLVERGLDAPAPFGEMFWGMHDAAYVLQRWSAFVPADRIHVVTVAHPGAPSDLLWQRFCRVTGLAPAKYDTKIERANKSMGVAETELVRRMNFEVKGMAPDSYDALVRRLLAEELLGSKSAKLVLPPDRMPWALERSRHLIDEVSAAGYAVEGDLEELMPRPSDHARYVSPTELTDADLGDAAVRAATGLLKQAGRQRRRINDLQHQLAGTTPPPAPKRRLRGRARDAYLAARRRVGGAIRRSPGG